MDKLKMECSSFDDVVIGLINALKQKATVAKEFSRLEKAFSTGNFTNQKTIEDSINKCGKQLEACQAKVDHHKHLLKHVIYLERMPREESPSLLERPKSPR